MTRILLDANILISYLLNPHADRPITQVVQAGGLGTHTLLLPEASLEEMSTKIAEERYLKERIDQADADQLSAVLWRVGETIAAIDDPIPAVTRAPKDDYLLAYAVIGLVDYLLTVDEDLLVQRQVQGVTICNPGLAAGDCGVPNGGGGGRADVALCAAPPSGVWAPRWLLIQHKRRRSGAVSDWRPSYN